MNSRLSELFVQHDLTIRELGGKLNIAPSTLSNIFNRSVGKWPVEVLEEISAQLSMSLNELYGQLSSAEISLHPFVKWAGGKRQLLSKIDEYIPEKFNTYYEPFLGGGALFLHIRPQKSVVNDFNEELINTWRVVKSNHGDLRNLTDVFSEKNSKEFYLWLRSADRDGRIDSMTDVERAARFLFLNKTGFNGLWRVNKSGQNNVPYGKYTNPTVYDPIINDVSKFLNSSDNTIMQGDYHRALSEVSAGDFVYLDSPYDVASHGSSFTGYTQNGFDTEDQRELRDVYASMTHRGAKIIESNADTELINDLYAGISGVRIIHIKAKRSINSNASGRGPVGEVLILNY